MATIGRNPLFQGCPVTAMLWWAWFRKPESSTRDRGLVISGIVLSIAALAVGRILAATLPFRQRPCFNPALHLRLPETPPILLLNWNSFPSDHAVMYFSLATCLFFVSRKIGLLAYLQAFFFVSLPRVYFGVHYPTDILAGALIGIGMASLSLTDGLGKFVKEPCLLWLQNSPRTFYPCLYLITMLMTMEFDPVRHIVIALWRVL